jgi:methionyl-tRNA synthetase
MNAQTHTYTITAALPYANGPIHIGHLAGAYIPADIYARYLRSKKQRVLFISGSDEHGVPITIRAQQEGCTPQQIVDKYHTLNKQSLEAFGISFDIFSRTSSEVHHQTATEFFTRLHEQGILEVHESEQYYDTTHQQFLADRYIKGACPKCGYEEAYGDQCEKCGSTLSPDELLNPRSALSGEKPVLKLTKHWYLPLNKYEAWLKHWILEEHTDWKSNVYGQCKSWLDQGLQPRAVTRDLSWGVPVPLPEASNKVLYVWFDAPIGYISATKEWAAAHNQDWEPFWKDPQTKLVHFIGKDNIVFHGIIFPVMLKAYGSFILPENIPANEFLNLEGKKISTSRKYAVWLGEYLVEFPNQQDALRYVLCVNAPETKDADFSWLEFQAKNNNELVATLGNFVNRSLVLVHKYFEGRVPVRTSLTDLDQSVIEHIRQAPERIGKAIEQFKFKEAIQHWMDLARIGNKYLADTEPWHLIKTNPAQVQTILNLALQLTATLAVLGEPFLHFTSQKLYRLLGLEGLTWDDTGGIDLIAADSIIQAPELLFTRFEDEAIKQQQAKLVVSVQTPSKKAGP